MDFHDITLSDVERLLRSLQEARPGDADLIRQIINRVQPNQTIPHPRVTIGQLFKLLEQTGGATALPENIAKMFKTEAEPQLPLEQPSTLINATVIKVDFCSPKPEDFEKVGTRVRIRRDSKYANQNDGEGKVTESVRGGDWVSVKWDSDDKAKYCYRIGRDGKCDLELAKPLPAVVTVKLTHGHTMEIAAPANQTYRAGDAVTVNRETTQLLPRLEPQALLERATVLKINQPEPTPADFERIGVRVRLRADSEFAHQNSGEGTVVGPEDDENVNNGWVRVQFDDGEGEAYRTGYDNVNDGACDLELVEPPQFTATVVINNSGKVLEVLAPTGRWLSVGDEVFVNRETMQIKQIIAVK